MITKDSFGTRGLTVLKRKEAQTIRGMSMNIGKMKVKRVNIYLHQGLGDYPDNFLFNEKGESQGQ